jgi:hypothetical protein
VVTDPGSSITGDVGGATITVADSVVTQSSAQGRSNAVIVLSASPNICATLGSPDALDAVTYLYATISIDAPQISTGTYAIANADGGSSMIAAYIWRSTGNCQQTEDIATGGTITLNVLTTDGATGTFAIDFSDGHFDGAFDSPTCNVVASTSSPCN